MAKKEKAQPDEAAELTWRVIKRSEIPPRPPIMRKGFWDSVIRDVIPLKAGKVLKVTFAREYFVQGMESSAHKAAARAGIAISAASRDQSMYLWVVDRTKTERRKSPCTP
jgi:hypothetical protein